MQTTQTYYQAFYQQADGKHVIDVYVQDKKVDTITRESRTPLKDIIRGLCEKLGEKGDARIHLHSHRNHPTKDQYVLDQLADEVGRSIRVNGSLVWIGGPSSPP